MVKGAQSGSSRFISHPISTPFPGTQHHNIHTSSWKLGLIIWGHKGYGMCFTSYHRKLAVAVQVNSLGGINSSPAFVSSAQGHGSSFPAVWNQQSFQRERQQAGGAALTALHSLGLLFIYLRFSIWTFKQQFCTSWRTPCTLWRLLTAQVSGGTYRKKQALTTKQETERRDPAILTLLISEWLHSNVITFKCRKIPLQSFNWKSRSKNKLLWESSFPFMPPLLHRNRVAFLCRWTGIIKRKGSRFPSGSPEYSASLP